MTESEIMIVLFPPNTSVSNIYTIYYIIKLFAIMNYKSHEKSTLKNEKIIMIPWK